MCAFDPSNFPTTSLPISFAPARDFPGALGRVKGSLAVLAAIAQEDTAGLFKRLTFAGVNIVTLAEGDITTCTLASRAR